MTCRTLVALVALFFAPSDAQLRPKRVGASALGEQQEVPDNLGGGGGGGGMAGLEGLAGLEEMMGGAGGGDMGAAMKAMAQMMGGGDGAGGLDMGALMKGLDPENNPLLKGLAEANPEIAKVLQDPEALQGQMAQMAELMSSEEGQNMAKNMMQQFADVMTDPEKLKSGLEQLSSNPALKGLADAVPGLRDVLDNPEALSEQAEKAAELFQSLNDPEKAQEMLSSLTDGANGDAGEALANLQQALGGNAGAGMDQMQDAIKKVAAIMQGAGGEAGADGLGGMDELLKGLGGLGGLGGDDGLDGEMGGGGEGDDLKARVRQQLAAMMANRRGGDDSGMGMDEEEF